jgi:hypothetical protein
MEYRSGLIVVVVVVVVVLAVGRGSEAVTMIDDDDWRNEMKSLDNRSSDRVRLTRIDWLVGRSDESVDEIGLSMPDG